MVLRNKRKDLFQAAQAVGLKRKLFIYVGSSTFENTS